MLPNFSALPPEVNSARLYTGAGPVPMLTAAAAWDLLASEMHCAADSFGSTIAALAAGSWQGPASLAMTAAAAPHLRWLSTAAAHAEAAAVMARTAAAEFDTALAAAVPPTVVAVNRGEVVSLLASNLFGQNAAAIAAAESLYNEMWAQDVTAMVAYHAGVSTVCAQLAPWQRRLQTLLSAATPGLPVPARRAVPPRRRPLPKSWEAAASRPRRPGMCSAHSISSFATSHPTPSRARCSPRRVSTRWSTSRV
ncbi:PPE family protein [Mycobacterium gordonae]|uniref:PPE family protein n=1 Tax=Mycobacterium gordonae TaxID=1778 RepID=UPI0012E38CE6